MANGPKKRLRIAKAVQADAPTREEAERAVRLLLRWAGDEAKAKDRVE